MSERVESYAELVPEVRRIYAEHLAGCCWHAVLDDSNFTRSCVEMCASYAEERVCVTCLPLARLMRLPGATLTKLSKAQRVAFHEMREASRR